LPSLAPLEMVDGIRRRMERCRERVDDLPDDSVEICRAGLAGLATPRGLRGPLSLPPPTTPLVVVVVAPSLLLLFFLLLLSSPSLSPTLLKTSPPKNGASFSLRVGVAGRGGCWWRWWRPVPLSPSRWCSCGHHLACTLACLALVHSRGDDLGLLSVARSLLTPMTLSLPPLPSALAGLPPPTRFSRPSPSTSSTLPSSTSASRTSSSGSYRAPTPSSWCVASLLPSCERRRRTGEGIGGAEWLADRPTGWWSEYER
jgi:hypothetical protein